MRLDSLMGPTLVVGDALLCIFMNLKVVFILDRLLDRLMGPTVTGSPNGTSSDWIHQKG